MPLGITTNIRVAGTKAIDDKYGKLVNGITVPYASVDEALSLIEMPERYPGLNIMVDNGSGRKELWLSDSLTVFTEKAPSTVGVFTNMSNTTWDGTEKKKSLSVDESWTLSTTKTVGIALVTGNNRSLSINDTPVVLKPIGVTIVGYVRDGSNYYFETNHSPLDGKPILAPGNFTATTFSTTQINLTWSDVENESSYKILFNTVNSFNTATVLSTPAAGSTSYNHTSLSPNSTFYYWIQGIGDGNIYINSPYVTSTATTNNVQTLVISDNFNRTAAPIGTADQGGPWTQIQSIPVDTDGTSAGGAVSGGTYAHAMINTSIANYEIETKLLTTGLTDDYGACIYFRCNSTATQGNILLLRTGMITGTVTGGSAIGTSVFGNNDVCKVVVKDSLVKVYKNGTLVAQATLGTPAGNWVGMLFTQSANHRFDYFTVKTAP